jgi:hypothetical protein
MRSKFSEAVEVSRVDETSEFFFQSIAVLDPPLVEAGLLIHIEEGEIEQYFDRMREL